MATVIDRCNDKEDEAMTKTIPLLLLLVLTAGCASMDDMSSDGKMMQGAAMHKEPMADEMKTNSKM